MTSLRIDDIEKFIYKPKEEKTEGDKNRIDIIEDRLDLIRSDVESFIATQKNKDEEQDNSIKHQIFTIDNMN